MRGPGVIQYSAVIETDGGRFTVGVFQNAAWAAKGLDALKNAGFPTASMSILVKDSPDAGPLIERLFGVTANRLDLPILGVVLVHGPLLEAIQGAAVDLPKVGLAAAMKRVGFQAHDGRIFEALAGRGGVLIAIKTEPRAADALAILHSYGGGNAAIGAWSGRV
jgi:hypothetical protein